MKNRALIVAVNVLMISILACGLPSGQAKNLSATITAQALLLQAPSDTPAVTPAASSSSTPSVPEVSVSTATNCRTGPGQEYDKIYGMNPGETAQVVGKYTPANYLIINMPGGGTCWLWGQYATVTGNVDGLPEVAPPPPPPPPTAGATKTPKPSSTPEPQPPAAPSNLAGAYDRTCAGDTRGGVPIWVEDVTVTWQDNADNETGYHIYKNGSLISTLAANATSFHIQLRYNQGTGGTLYDNFGVEAFNDAGTSGKPSMDVPKCP